MDAGNDETLNWVGKLIRIPINGGIAQVLSVQKKTGYPGLLLKYRYWGGIRASRYFTPNQLKVLELSPEEIVQWCLRRMKS